MKKQSVDIGYDQTWRYKTLKACLPLSKAERISAAALNKVLIIFSELTIE